jgi:hypothetical protein
VTANLPGVIVFGLFAVLCLLGAAFAIYEAWALAAGWEPITPFVRADIDHHRMLALAIFGFFCIAAGHFWR